MRVGPLQDLNPARKAEMESVPYLLGFCYNRSRRAKEGDDGEQRAKADTGSEEPRSSVTLRQNNHTTTTTLHNTEAYSHHVANKGIQRFWKHSMQREVQWRYNKVDEAHLPRAHAGLVAVEERAHLPQQHRPIRIHKKKKKIKCVLRRSSPTQTY